MKKCRGAILICIYTCLTADFSPSVFGEIVYESATLGPVNQVYGLEISEYQYFGSRFFVSEKTEIIFVGGHIASNVGLLIFAAVVKLADSTSLPRGTPFIPSDIVETACFRPPWWSDDVFAEISVVLEPGWYGLVFGANGYGSSRLATSFMPTDGQVRLNNSTYFAYNDDSEVWFPTFPSSYPRFVVKGQPIRPQQIKGAKFNDINANGSWDNDEPAIPGWDIYLDNNGNGFLDDGEPNSVTDPNGFYEFLNLLPGTYSVAEVMEDGWSQTYPSGTGTHTVVVDVNEVVTGVNFGNVEGGGYSYGGGSGTRLDPYLIYDPNQMQKIGENAGHWDKHFRLMADISLAGVTGTQYHVIGMQGKQFTGSFDGNYHAISDFAFRGSYTQALGLFGQVGKFGLIENLTVYGQVERSGGGENTAILAGVLQGGSIQNCRVEGSVESAASTGGLIGSNDGGYVENCLAKVDITGSVAVGGLVGENNSPAQILTCYSTGPVSGQDDMGGLIGRNSGTVSNSFWDVDRSGQTSSGGGTGRTTSQMCSQATYTGWDFDNIWAICDGANYPKFQWVERVFCDFGCPDGVEAADLIALSRAWLTGPSDAEWDPQCDLDMDSLVGLGDIAVLSENWMSGTD